MSCRTAPIAASLRRNYEEIFGDVELMCEGYAACRYIFRPYGRQHERTAFAARSMLHRRPTWVCW
ncbi:MAG: hypothetical protein K2K57_00715 [Oscillospiraceae bacterium]|nr:hypothetical protein [Oscillospiraceae bacterium]